MSRYRDTLCLTLLSCYRITCVPASFLVVQIQDHSDRPKLPACWHGIEDAVPTIEATLSKSLCELRRLSQDNLGIYLSPRAILKKWSLTC